MGTIKRDTQIRAIKNAKDELSHPPSPGRRSQHICPSTSGPNRGSPNPLASGASSVSPGPPGARTQTPPRPTPLASGASSISLEPSRAWAPTPLRPTRARLPTHGAHTHEVTGAVTPISQQGMVATIPTTLDTATLPLSLCNLTSFTMVYCLTVKEEWERLINTTLCCLLSLLTCQAAVLPTRPPRLRQGSVTLHRSNHTINHTSRTGWASCYRVGTVTPPLSRKNLQSFM